MILNFNDPIGATIAPFIEIVDAATGASLNHMGIHHADDQKATYRTYDRDQHGLFTRRNRATRAPVCHRVQPDGPRTPARYLCQDGTLVPGNQVEISWTEYYLPIRFEPRRDLDPAMKTTIARMLDQLRATDPTEDQPR